MEPFAEHLYRRLAEGILLADCPRLEEAYILSLYVDFDDGPHRMKLWLYYNTPSRLREAISQGEQPGEARWHFALWEPEFVTAVGLSKQECERLADAESHRLLARWLARRGLYRSPEQLAVLLEHPRRYDAWEGAAREALLDLVARVARRLHDTGIILSRFGRVLPLLVHQWEYDMWCLEATRRVNPPGLVTDFERWWWLEWSCG